MPLRFTIPLLLGAIAFAILVACVRAVLRSRRLQRQYRLADPKARAALDARVLGEPELAEYMLPVPLWQVALGLTLVAALIFAKFTGMI
jgi:NADH:ubiquinone oxidoreductase subunit 6 (subunit J)